MLLRAYPRGLPDEDYEALISLLYEHMSDRNLAQVISHLFSKEYIVVWNDVGRIQSGTKTSKDASARVLQTLTDAGYAEWTRESPP